jgi:S-sulfosulfanyl-L-cysteine sulfohydrolase
MPSRKSVLGASRREFLRAAMAAAALMGGGRDLRAQAVRQRITESDLLRFSAKGQVTILHMADCHGQLMPVYFREPFVNLGVGDARGLPPHITGASFLAHFGIEPGSHLAYSLTSEDFVALARAYGKVGGMDRLARLVKAIRAERGDDKVLLLDGGDALQGSYTALKSQGGDMVRVIDALGVEATTGHWEFTLGRDRLTEIYGDRQSKGRAKTVFLAGNVLDNEWQEPAFASTKFFEKNGVNIAVIGQALPYTGVAHPRWIVGSWTFGIRENLLRQHVGAARAAGAELVVLLSHNGFDVDRKLAKRVEGIDVILTAHTHDALPVAVKVNSTLLIASGSSAKFLSRLDVGMKDGRMVDYSYALIPVLADAIEPDPEMSALIADIRAPHEAMLSTAVARTESLLYRRGNFAGTMDDLICAALIEERDAEIALSPGFRWGASILPGADITWDDVYSETAITYPTSYRATLSGEQLKAILEDVADNIFNPDPYYQQGGDMVRVGGLALTMDVDAAIGQRIGDLRLIRNGQPIDPARNYVTAGWASLNESVQGPPVWEILGQYLQRRRIVRCEPNDFVKFVRSR